MAPNGVARDGATPGARPQLWVFAGPNRAGKTTLVARRVRDRAPVVNPDEIAATLPLGRDGGPDVLAAGRLAVQARERHLAARESFAFETTLTGRGELALMERAKQAGYQVALFYVGLGSAELSVQRVARRVQAGGHDVPREDLFRRYDRSLGNLAPALALADRAFVLDNSGERRRLVLARVDGQTRALTRQMPAWVERAVPASLRQPRAQGRGR